MWYRQLLNKSCLNEVDYDFKNFVLFFGFNIMPKFPRLEANWEWKTIMTIRKFAWEVFGIWKTSLYQIKCLSQAINRKPATHIINNNNNNCHERMHAPKITATQQMWALFINRHNKKVFFFSWQINDSESLKLFCTISIAWDTQVFLEAEGEWRVMRQSAPFAPGKKRRIWGNYDKMNL